QLDAIGVADDHVTPGCPAGHVQPRVTRLGHPEGQVIIVFIPPAHQDLEAPDAQGPVRTSLARHVIYRHLGGNTPVPMRALRSAGSRLSSRLAERAAVSTSYNA